MSKIILSWEIECENPEVVLVIPEGAPVSQVCDSLKANYCNFNENIFKAGLYLQGKSRGIYSGKYPMKGILTIGSLTKLITAPSGKRVKVTLIEGWELERIIDELNLYLDINPYKFRKACYDNNFMSIHSNKQSVCIVLWSQEEQGFWDPSSAKGYLNKITMF